jgi:hypothetical protein
MVFSCRLSGTDRSGADDLGLETRELDLVDRDDRRTEHRRSSAESPRSAPASSPEKDEDGIYD